MLNKFTLLKYLSVLLGRLVLSCGYLEVFSYQLCRNFHWCFKGKMVFFRCFFKLVSRNHVRYLGSCKIFFSFMLKIGLMMQKIPLLLHDNFSHSCHVALLFCKWHFIQNKVSQCIWMTKVLSSRGGQGEGWKNTVLKNIYVFFVDFNTYVLLFR